VWLNRVAVFLLDEADRLLDMGFIPDVKRVIRLTPSHEQRQTLLLSATFSQDIMNFASHWTKDAVVVEVAPDHVTTETVEQKVYIAETEQKDRKSTRLNSSHVSISYAVFCLKKKKKYIN